MVAEESSEEIMETEREKKKSFSVGSIEVCTIVKYTLHIHVQYMIIWLNGVKDL